MTNTLCEAQQLLSFPNSVTARNSNSFFRGRNIIFDGSVCGGRGGGEGGVGARSRAGRGLGSRAGMGLGLGVAG